MNGLLIIRNPALPSRPLLPRTDEEFCIGCTVCARVCPVDGVIDTVREEVSDGVCSVRCDIPLSKREKTVAVPGSRPVPLPVYCVSCRRCVEECPTGARHFMEGPAR